MAFPVHRKRTVGEIVGIPRVAYIDLRMPYAPTKYIKVEHNGPVVTITLNNPDMLNAFVDEMHTRMCEIWWDLADDDSVKAVILTGEGKAFSAGGNIPDFIRNVEDLEFRRKEMRTARRMMEAMASFHKPVIAAVNGPAVGLGINLALLSDFVFINDATFVADTHVAVGLVAGDGGAVFWPLMMGLLRCKEYLLTGERIPAAKAVELGLATKTVPAADLMNEARAMADRLVAMPHQALQETKRALNLHLQDYILRAAPFALAAESESFSTPDINTVVENFKNKK